MKTDRRKMWDRERTNPKKRKAQNELEGRLQLIECYAEEAQKVFLCDDVVAALHQIVMVLRKLEERTRDLELYQKSEVKQLRKGLRRT